MAQIASERINEMQDPEIILNMLAEASTKDISQAVQPKDFDESKKVAKQGGNVAKVARKELESRTGQKVVSSVNAKSLLKENKTKEKILKALKNYKIGE